MIVETGAAQRVSDVALAPGECLLFGPETRGLPAGVGEDLGVPLVRASLPMRPSNRSLNLSNAVAVTVYEAWRQNALRRRRGWRARYSNSALTGRRISARTTLPASAPSKRMRQRPSLSGITTPARFATSRSASAAR